MKNRTFFAADTHFGHRKIVDGFSQNESDHTGENSGRPFDSIEEHDEVIVTNWNSEVRPEDTVWLLGDVMLGNDNFDIIKRLNGKKKLILGNHDTWNRIKTFIEMEIFTKIEAYGKIGKSTIISHVPLNTCELETRFKVNIHGHRHHMTLDDPRYFNVSMEAIDYKPISFDDIRSQLRDRGVI